MTITVYHSNYYSGPYITVISFWEFGARSAAQHPTRPLLQPLVAAPSFSPSVGAEETEDEGSLALCGHLKLWLFS